MSEPPAFDSRSLDAQAAWIHSLARHLIADRHFAEDLAQDTLLRALHVPPQRPDKLRSWLRRVLRHGVFRWQRREAGRRSVEGSAARGEGTDALDVLSATNQVHERILQAVLALGRIYREVVLLRFFEELPPREIARRLALPVETVRTRLKRAFSMLRRSLAQEDPTPRAVSIPVSLFPGGAHVIAVPKIVLTSAAVFAVVGTVLIVSPPQDESDPLGRTAEISWEEDRSLAEASPGKEPYVTLSQPARLANPARAPARADVRLTREVRRETVPGDLPVPAGHPHIDLDGTTWCSSCHAPADGAGRGDFVLLEELRRMQELWRWRFEPWPGRSEEDHHASGDPQSCIQCHAK